MTLLHDHDLAADQRKRPKSTRRLPIVGAGGHDLDEGHDMDLEATA